MRSTEFICKIRIEIKHEFIEQLKREENIIHTENDMKTICTKERACDLMKKMRKIIKMTKILY